MGTRCGTAVADLDDGANLAEGQTSRLRCADEPEAADRHVVVHPVAIGCPVWFGQQPATFVEPHRPGGNLARFSELTDSHQMTIALDLLLQERVYRRSMNVTLLYFDGCPNWKTADGHLHALAAQFPGLTVTRRRVETPEEALRVGFRGSPSVVLDGVDLFADPDTPVGLACRVYETPDGPAGSPTLDQLREVLGRG